MTDRLEPLWISWSPDHGITYALAPKVCRRRGCDTVLSRFNAGSECWFHTSRTFPSNRVRSMPDGR